MCEGAVWEARPCLQLREAPGWEREDVDGAGGAPREVPRSRREGRLRVGCPWIFLRRQIKLPFCQLWLDPLSAF